MKAAPASRGRLRPARSLEIPLEWSAPRDPDRATLSLRMLPSPLRPAVVCLASCLALASAARADTVDVRIAAASDDAEEVVADGGVTADSSDLELVTDGSDVQLVGVRFPGVAVPAGATIQQAWVQFQTDEVSTGAASLVIEGVTTPQAPTFAETTGNLSGRPRTAASVAWTPAAWSVVGEQAAAQRTPDLALVLQELVSAPTWGSGDAVVLIFTGSGRRTAEAYDGVPAAAPLLHVEYDLSGNASPSLTVTAPAQNAGFDEGAPVAFAASASDPEDGDLSADITWESSLDGALGTGASFSRDDLSVGAHTLTARVVDGDGAEAQRTRQINVFSPTNQVLAAGNVGYCPEANDEATGALLGTLPGRILALGDLAYPQGTAADFANCFHPAWGMHKARIHPISGNHEWHEDGAQPYFDYFGAAAGTPGEGWYSFDVGNWHLVGVQGDCNEFPGGCAPSSPQGLWLQADLAANSKPCTLVFTHFPRFSSIFGVDDTQLPFWQIFYQHGVDVVLTAHAHNYERYARQNPAGGAEPARGIRQFVVGTGGRGLSDPSVTLPNREVQQSSTFGVLRLAFDETSYSWQFHGAGPGTFTDSGSEECVYGAPAVTITSPSNGASFASGATVNLTGTATDLEQGNVSSQLAWSSSRDGALGTGASLSRVLSAGQHVLTASVTDQTDLTGSAQVTVQVAAPPGVGCGLGPELLPALALLALLRRRR
jgi:hypothetical protein